jgi:hypothetical protein
LTEPLPDHSSLTRLRDRYGLDVFRRFFEAIVEQCIAAGLVWGQELYVDATKVEGDAALDSLQPRFAVEDHLARLFVDAEAGGDGEDGGDHGGADDPPAPTPLPIQLTAADRADLAAAAAARHDRIGGAGRPDRSVVRAGYRRQADFWASATDPDATPLRPPNPRPHLGYHDHDVVDGGKARIVLAAPVTPAEATENLPTVDLLWWARFRWKLRPRQVTGDATYGTIDNIVAIEDAGPRAYVGLTDFDHRTPSFGRDAFAYDADADAYRCPGGETLTLRALDTVTRVRGYQAPAAACAACPLKPECTGGRGGRSVHRSFDEAYLERVRGYRATEPVPEGAPQAAGLGGTAVRRGQGLARAAPLPAAGAGEGQRGGIADRGRAEPEAAAEPRGLGPPPVAERGGRVGLADPRADADGLRLTHPANLHRRGQRRTIRHLTPFFNTLAGWRILCSDSYENPGCAVMGTGVRVTS